MARHHSKNIQQPPPIAPLLAKCVEEELSSKGTERLVCTEGRHSDYSTARKMKETQKDTEAMWSLETKYRKNKDRCGGTHL